jgi:ABC-type nickel/cobalt efflux system permease component RcnA
VEVVRSVSPTGEPTAWARAQLGDLLFQAGDLAGADAAYRDALAAAPGYHRALAGAARVRWAQGQYRDAVERYQKAPAVIPGRDSAARVGHHHHHEHPHDHDHAHGHAHPHVHAHDGHDHGDAPVSLRALVALGVSGGIIPCPAALVVLLSVLSMHRVGFGLVLIVAFSVGLAAVLVTIGVLMVYAGRLMTRFREDGPWIRRWLPLTSSAVMTLLGLGIVVQAMVPWIPR